MFEISLGNYIQKLRPFNTRIFDATKPVAVWISTGMFSGIGHYIVQQPKNNNAFVSRKPQNVTQFGLAWRKNKVIGLLIHDQHDLIKVVNHAVIILGNGVVIPYDAVTDYTYWANYPNDPNTNYTSSVEHDSTDTASVTAAEVFNNVYDGFYPLIIQTCIGRFGVRAAGRYFRMFERKD